MTQILAPCGEPASIKHFKTCQHFGCMAKLAVYEREKAATKASLQRFFKAKENTRGEDA